MSIAAFNQRQGLTPHTFRSWRQELARRDGRGTTEAVDQALGPPTELAVRSPFLPVRVVPDEPDPSHETTPAEILLTTGPTVRVTRGFDPQTLDAVLAVLEARRRQACPPVRILLAREPADMRKGFDGLAHLVQSVLAEDLFSGHLFVFRSRRGDRLKVLYRAGDAFALWYRRLENGTFRFPAPSMADATSVPVKAADLHRLLEGAGPKRVRRRPRYARQPA